MKSDLVDITVMLKHETAKAWLVDDGSEKAVWIPKSNAELEPNRDGRTFTLTLPSWLAIEKGLA